MLPMRSRIVAARAGRRSWSGSSSRSRRRAALHSQYRFHESDIESEARRGGKCRPARIAPEISGQQKLRRRQTDADERQRRECTGIRHQGEDFSEMAAKEWTGNAADHTCACHDRNRRNPFLRASRGVDGGETVVLAESAEKAEQEGADDEDDEISARKAEKADRTTD